MIDIITFKEWVNEHYDAIFRYWIYRRMFTPFEQNEKFVDEVMYEDRYASSGYIREIIQLPDNDLLIGFLYPDKDFERMDYYKLSEIRIEYIPGDKDEWEETD